MPFDVKRTANGGFKILVDVSIRHPPWLLQVVEKDPKAVFASVAKQSRSFELSGKTRLPRREKRSSQ
jgi:hypothetical protein